MPAAGRHLLLGDLSVFNVKASGKMDFPYVPSWNGIEDRHLGKGNHVLFDGHNETISLLELQLSGYENIKW